MVDIPNAIIFMSRGFSLKASLRIQQATGCRPTGIFSIITILDNADLAILREEYDRLSKVNKNSNTSLKSGENGAILLVPYSPFLDIKCILFLSGRSP